MKESVRRWDAILQRSRAEWQRTESTHRRAEGALIWAEEARGRAKATRDHARDVLARFDDLGGFLADKRDALAVMREEAEAGGRARLADLRRTQAEERDRLAAVRHAQVDERARIARQRELSEDINRADRNLRRIMSERESLHRAWTAAGDQGVRLHLKAAELADQMAAEADAFATHLENNADRGDRPRRLAVARAEHEIARRERQHAAKLRQLDARYHSGPPLPKLPGTGLDRKDARAT
jgi:hypothetical protein